MFILGIITARGGSKGIPKKNIYPLNDKPLIDYTIDAAEISDLDDWVLSTDDIEITGYGRNKVIMRPFELAQDDTPTLPVLQYTVSEYERIMGVRVDAVMTLQPTSPFRSVEDINDCIKLFKQGYDSITTVYNGTHPIKSYDENFKPYVLQNQPYRKQIHKCYTRNGAVFITSREVLDNGKIMGDNIGFHIMPKSRSIDIDDYEDLKIAEALLKYGN